MHPRMFVKLMCSLITVATVAVMAPAAIALDQNSLDCGDVITESVTLTRGLFGCGALGLAIGKDGITVDLGGNTISGTDAGGSTGIDLQGFDRVIVRNGVVRDFSDGVDISGVVGGAVSRLSIFSGGGNGFLGGGTRVLLSRNTISQMGAAIALPSASGIQIVRNIVRDSTNGITTNGQNIIVRGNRISGVTFNPLFLGGSDNRAIGNVVEGNRDDGIVVGGNSNAAIGNIVKGNTTSGIRLSGNTSILKNNVSNGNNGDGYFVESGALQNTVINNTAIGNQSDGFDIDATTIKVIENTARRNGFAGGVATGTEFGIVAPDVAGVKGRDNVATGNDGIDCFPARLC
jgi:large repetitive protein